MKKLAVLILIVAVGFFGYNHFFKDDDASAVSTGGRTTTCTRCKGSGICTHCSGDGFRDGRRCGFCDGAKRCSACLGKGRHTVYENNGQDYIQCTSCHGSGKCGVCNGACSMDYGTMFGKRIIDDCMNCKGSGRCTLCKGSGATRLSSF